MYSFRLLHPFR